MQVALITEMEEALEFPVYVFRETTPGMCLVDKVQKDGSKFTRDRYLIIAGQQCTCLGFIRFKHCKHLEMYKDQDGWVKRGVMASVAVEECERLLEILGKKKGLELQPIGLDNLPEYVKIVEISVKHDGLKDLRKLVSHKKFGTLGDLGVVVSIKK